MTYTGRRSPPPARAAWLRSKRNATSPHRARQSRRSQRNETAGEHGLGQTQGVSRRRRGGQLYPCRRKARTVAIGGVAAGFFARKKNLRGVVFSAPPPRPSPPGR